MSGKVTELAVAASVAADRRIHRPVVRRVHDDHLESPSRHISAIHIGWRTVRTRSAAWTKVSLLPLITSYVPALSASLPTAAGEVYRAFHTIEVAVELCSVCLHECGDRAQFVVGSHGVGVGRCGVVAAVATHPGEFSDEDCGWVCAPPAGVPGGGPAGHAHGEGGALLAVYADPFVEIVGCDDAGDVDGRAAAFGVAGVRAPGHDVAGDMISTLLHELLGHRVVPYRSWAGGYAGYAAQPCVVLAS